ncbi:DUF2281 domain-containing protein [uncultured Thiothrix sp.]|uniref:DUF2281 domain-containing protein n=1 Tax=uncultured Thiothrix sp. TaxID=223185 RepID=UPI00261DBF59|nr:DUF2281 domain-containing protein [uncultured Thiothrix sp.]
MSTMTASELLVEQAKTLPENLAMQVLDFLEYLKAKQLKQPNQTTIDAINDDEAETVTLEQLRALCK